MLRPASGWPGGGGGRGIAGPRARRCRRRRRRPRARPDPGEGGVPEGADVADLASLGRPREIEDVAVAISRTATVAPMAPSAADGDVLAVRRNGHGVDGAALLAPDAPAESAHRFAGSILPSATDQTWTTLSSPTARRCLPSGVNWRLSQAAGAAAGSRTNSGASRSRRLLKSRGVPRSRPLFGASAAKAAASRAATAAKGTRLRMAGSPFRVDAVRRGVSSSYSNPGRRADRRSTPRADTIRRPGPPRGPGRGPVPPRGGSCGRRRSAPWRFRRCCSPEGAFRGCGASAARAVRGNAPAGRGTRPWPRRTARVEQGEQLFAVASPWPVSRFGVALGGLVEGDLAERLVQGDAHQQLAQVVLVLKNELAVLEADEEGAEDRLNDVLGVHTTGEALADAPVGERRSAGRNSDRRSDGRRSGRPFATGR